MGEIPRWDYLTAYLTGAGPQRAALHQERKRPRPRFESWDARRTALPQNCSTLRLGNWRLGRKWPGRARHLGTTGLGHQRVRSVGENFKATRKFGMEELENSQCGVYAR